MLIYADVICMVMPINALQCILMYTTTIRVPLCVLWRKKDIILAIRGSRRSSHLEPLFDGSARETRQTLSAKEPTVQMVGNCPLQHISTKLPPVTENEKFQTEILLTKWKFYLQNIFSGNHECLGGWGREYAKIINRQVILSWLKDGKRLTHINM